MKKVISQNQKKFERWWRNSPAGIKLGDLHDKELMCESKG